jgi:hypothetical protein
MFEEYDLSVDNEWLACECPEIHKEEVHSVKPSCILVFFYWLRSEFLFCAAFEEMTICNSPSCVCIYICACVCNALQTFSFSAWLSSVTFEPRTAPNQTRCWIQCKNCHLTFQSSEVLRWFLLAYKRTGSVQALAGVFSFILNGLIEDEDEESDDEYEYDEDDGAQYQNGSNQNGSNQVGSGQDEDVEVCRFRVLFSRL